MEHREDERERPKKNEKKVCGDESTEERERKSLLKKKFFCALFERGQKIERIFSSLSHTTKGITYPNSV